MAKESVIDAMLRFQETASVKQVFGEPTTVGDKVVIPVATVSYAFGFGYGGGPERQDEHGNVVQVGGGGGGGGRAHARPVAAIEITPQETRVKAIEDTTRIALGGMLTGAWAIFWGTATLRAFLKRRSRRR